MICIFDKDENLRSTLLQEEGFLHWAEAKIEEELNGQTSMDLSVPYFVNSPDHPGSGERNHPDVHWIEVENTLVVKMTDYNRDEEYFREFVIKETELDTEADLKIAYCHDSAIAELNDEKVEEKRPGYGSDSGTTARIALQDALEGSRWVLGIVEDLGLSRAHFFHESRLACVHKILEAWGAEVRFRVEVSGSGIVGRYVDLFAERGADRGKRIELGKDLMALNLNISSENLKTAIWPRGKGLKSDGEEDLDPAAGRRVSIAEVEWSQALGDPVEKPKGQEWIGLPEELEAWGRGKPGQKRHKMVDVVFEEIEDPETLAQEAFKLLQELAKPEVSADIRMMDLEHQTSHEAVRLGDTVRLVISSVDPAIRLRARVVKRVQYLGEMERTEVTIGSQVETTLELSREIRREVEKEFGKVAPITWKDSMIDLLNNEIVSSNAYLYMNTSDGMILFNRPRDQHPDEAMQMVAAGLRISATKDPEGEFIWTTAITAKGIHADAITTGQMKADRIGAGILSLGGKDFGAAQLFLRDREDNIIAHFDGEARSWNELRAGAMYAPNVPRRTTLEDELSTTSLYVHPVAGDDVEGDGTSSHPFRTLQRAVDFIPEVNDATWDIRVIEPTKYPISEHLEIRGFRGDGIVRFRMDGVRFNGWVRLSSNLHRFAFYGGHYYHNGQGHPRTPEGPIATFHVIRTNILYMENCYVSAEQKAEHAMSATYGSFVEAHDCYFDRGLRNGAQAIRGSKMYINNCGGRENGEFGAYASINSEIAISGDVVDQKIYCPAGKGGGTGEDHFFWYSTWTSEVRVPSTYAGRKRSGSRVAIPENKILTAYPTEVASWRGQGGDTDDGRGWHVGRLLQGAGFYPHLLAEGEDGYGGNHAGFVWFGNINFKTRLAGRTIKDVRVQLRRAPRFTPDTPKEVQCWLHNYVRQDEAEDWEPSRVLMESHKVGSYSWNDERRFTLPRSAGERLAKGEAIGLAFFHEDWTQGLEIVPRSVVLEVVYE